MAGPMMAGPMAGPPILVGERILWLGSGSGVPRGGTVRWMGKLPEMGPSWTLGIELDMALPYGGIDGWWGGRRLFSCEARRGLLVPLSSVVREPQSPGLVNWQHSCEQQAAAPQQHQQHHYPAASPEYFAAANANQQYPKPAVRRKNVPSFVQSLPLVVEETRQAVYDTREHVQQQRLDEERREVAADTVSDTVSDTASAATAPLQPSAPPRQRSGVRLTRSGDFSAVSWQQAGPSHDLGHGPGPAAPPGLGVVRSSSAEVLPGPATASASTSATPASRPSSGYGLFSFFRWFKKGGRQDGVQGQPATATHSGSSDYDDEDDDDDDEDDGLQPAYPCRASTYGSYGSIDTVLSTATVSSFRFVRPGAYSQSPAVQRRDDLVAAPDTASYRLRIRQRDRRREAEKGISLRKKYRLYGSDTTIHRSHCDLPHAEGQDRRQGDILQERRKSDLVRKNQQSDEERRPSDLAETPESQSQVSPLGEQSSSKAAPKADSRDQKPSQSEASSRSVVVQSSSQPAPKAPKASNVAAGPNPFDEPEPSTSGTSCAAGKARKPPSTNPFEESDESDDDTTKPASAAPSTSTLSATSQSDLVGSTRAAAPPDRFPDVVVPTLGRKKTRESNDYSLPATLEHRDSSLTGPLYESATLHIGRYERHQYQHRRSVSDTTGSTDTERRLPAHVRGKRRAPTPPCDAGTGTTSRTSTASKKKRQAPLPPALLEERLEKERLERERLEKERLEQERLEKERLEQERLEKERLERERLEKEEKERLEKERVEKERAERDQLEQDRQRLERERKIEEGRLEKLRAEAERLEKEQLERQRLDRERRAEEERLAKEKAQRELLDRERDERRRLEKEKLERERLEKERNERERLERALEEKARETERLQREKGEAEQQLRERNERERIEQENIRRLEREIEQAKQTLERERLEKEKLDWELRLERLSDRLDRKGKGRKGGAGLSAAERERLLGNINKLEAHAARLGSPPGSPRPGAGKDVCRAAAAKETKDKENMAPGSPGTASTSGPVSPRPWYKRSSTHRDSGGFRDIFRSLEKRHKKAADEDDWMLESGVPRGSGVAAPQQDGGAHAASRFNIFSRLTEEWLGGDKRRSQVSMLANISELDREAAEIVQEQHARQAAVQARRDAEFYVNGNLEDGVAGNGQKDAPEDDPERPRKNSAKELISLFNAIGSAAGGPQEASATQEAKRGLFGGARSKSTDEEPLRCSGRNGLSAARRTTTTPSFYETGPEVAALSEQSFRVEAPLANADDDSDLATTTDSEPKAATKVVNSTVMSTAVASTSTPAKVVSTTAAIEKDISRGAPGHKGLVTASSTSTASPGPSMKADGRLLAGPSNPSKGSFWASDSRASATTTTTTITTSVSKAAMKTASTASSAHAMLDASARTTTATSDSKALPSAPTSAPPAQSTATPAVTASATSVFLNGQSLWVCPRCTLENPRWRFTCDACSMWRPAERRPAGLETREGEADVPPGPPAFLAEDKRAQEKALEKTKAPTTINWEAELKRYFNKDEKAEGGQSRTASSSSAQDVKAKTGAAQASASAASPARPEPKNNTASTPKVTASTSLTASPRPASSAGAVATPAQQTAVVKPQPSTTFVGGRLRQDEAVAGARSRLGKSKSEDVAGHLLGGQAKGQAPSAAADVEELRKARLAFFRSSAFVDEDNEDLTVALASMSTRTHARAAAPQDGGNLRDLLREMKAGLPDRQGASGAGLRVTGEASRAELRVEAKARSAASAAQGVAAARPTRAKVSSSAQTSAQVIRKQAEPPPPRPNPAASAVVQDGVLYTSLRRGSRRLGSGTFKLIGERDFVSRASNAPLYMNVLPRPQRDAGPAAPAPRAAAVDSSPERKSTTESAEFATPSSSSASSSRGGLSKAPSYGVASSSRSASRSDSPASFSSSSDRGDAPPFVGSPAASDRGVATASLSTPMTSSRASSVETPPSSAGRLSRDASMDSVASASTSASGPSRSLSVVSDCSEVDRLTEQLSAPQGIADFRAALNRAQGVDAAGLPDVNTLAVNRLLRRLEAAIASGQHQEAARLARDLARLKISCSVTRQRKQLDTITVDMYVEDKVSHQGPIPLQVTPSMTVGQLAAKVAHEFQLPENVQRWILGKQLANDRASTLRDHNVVESGCPVFLYLVAPEPDAESSDGGDGSSVSGQSGDYPNGVGEAQAPEPKRPPPPPADPNRRGGWYFNYEEDRYSFCEDSDEDLSEDDKAPVGPRQTVSTTTPTPAPRRVTSPAPPARAVASPEPATLRVTSPEPEPPTRTVTSPEPPHRRIKSPEPAVQRVKSPEPAGRGVVSPEPTRTATTAAGRGTAASAPAPRPGTLSPTPAPRRVFGSGAAPQPQHPPVRPQTSGYRSQPLQTVLATATTNTPTNTTTTPKVPASPPPTRAAAAKANAPAAATAQAAPTAAAAALKEKGEKQPSWRCPRCTLLNSGVRPGCAACTAERPAAAVADATGLELADAEEAERRQRERQYQLLVNLERQDLVPSVEAFECSVCLTEHPGGAGAVLRECLHTFCRACLIQTVQFSDDAEVKCPYRDKEYACDCVLQEREIKALVPAAMYEQHLAKSIKQAERKIENAFHCKTPDCAGWCIFEDNVNEFRCPVCRATNCLTCQAIHLDANCAEYQARLRREAADGSNEDARRTQAMLDEMVARGEALGCPSCHVLLIKKWGCDWLRCSMCKTEICWVTRKPRWGPGGKGDTTGGCQCGVNGIKCHPKCNYCH